MRHIVPITLALIAGIAGGYVGARAAASGDQKPKEMIRAQAFELVDATGKTISLWGVDSSNHAVLAFGSRGLAPLGAAPSSVPPGLRNPQNQLAVVGLDGTDSPVLHMNGPDGQRRAALIVTTDGKPVLSMHENDFGLTLGIELSDTPGPQDNNWSLAFFPETARIGMGVERQGKESHVRGVLFVNPKRQSP